MYLIDIPSFGSHLGRHFKMRDGRLIGYWATISRCRPGVEDFGKVF